MKGHVTHEAPDLAAALEARVSSALGDSLLSPQATEFLVELDRRLRAGEAPACCASCSRVEVGEWRRAPDELPWVTLLLRSRQSLCPECLAVLHARDHAY